MKKQYSEVIELGRNMIQWKFKMKKLCFKTIKTLTAQNSAAQKMRRLSEKSYLYYSIITLTNLKYLMSCKKAALPTRRSFERGTRNRHQRNFRKFWTIYTSVYRKCWSKDDFFMTLMGLRDFTDLSQHFRMYLVVFGLMFFIQRKLKVNSYVS